MKQEHVGSDFDDFLKQDGLLAECEAGALKRVVAWQIEREMKRRKISRAKLASRMKTNRATLDRLFAQNEDRKSHTSELQSLAYLVCRLLLEKKKKKKNPKDT